MIKEVLGDATRPQAVGTGPQIIVEVNNDRGYHDAGFARALNETWPAVPQLFRAWMQSKPRPGLGAVRIVALSSDPDIRLAFMIAQRGLRSKDNPHPIDYGYLRQTLTLVCREAQPVGGTLHLPKIGAGLGGGRWPLIRALIQETVAVFNLTAVIYTYVPP